MESVAIFVSGGPAPGINAVIHAAAIQLEKHGLKPLGVRGGFKDIASIGAAALMPLETKKVSRIAGLGGSFLGTSRHNPFLDEREAARMLQALRLAGVRKCIVIGGEGSAFLSMELAAKGLYVAHVPKTIDNDIPIPGGHPSFGYETARAVAAGVLQTLMTDAKSCERWYLVETMGRSSGFLALGAGIASGATATFIAEEFGEQKLSLRQLAEVVFEVIAFRYKKRRRHGVLVLSEGILDCIDESSDPRLENCSRDALGRLVFSDINICDLLLDPLKELAREHGIEGVFKTKSIGYELRSAPPCAFDLEYAKFLGFAAALLLAKQEQQGRAFLVTKQDGESVAVDLRDLARDGRIPVRHVQIDSTEYAVARAFMLRP